MSKYKIGPQKRLDEYGTQTIIPPVLTFGSGKTVELESKIEEKRRIDPNDLGEYEGVFLSNKPSETTISYIPPIQSRTQPKSKQPEEMSNIQSRSKQPEETWRTKSKQPEEMSNIQSRSGTLQSRTQPKSKQPKKSSKSQRKPRYIPKPTIQDSTLLRNTPTPYPVLNPESHTLVKSKHQSEVLLRHGLLSESQHVQDKEILISRMTNLILSGVLSYPYRRKYLDGAILEMFNILKSGKTCTIFGPFDAEPVPTMENRLSLSSINIEWIYDGRKSILFKVHLKIDHYLTDYFNEYWRIDTLILGSSLSRSWNSEDNAKKIARYFVENSSNPRNDIDELLKAEDKFILFQGDIIPIQTSETINLRESESRTNLTNLQNLPMLSEESTYPSLGLSSETIHPSLGLSSETLGALRLFSKAVHLLNIKVAGSFSSALSMNIVEYFGSRRIFDPCAGWGGRLIGCLALSSVLEESGQLPIEYYIGTDPNSSLQKSYINIVSTLTKLDRFNPSEQLNPEDILQSEQDHSKYMLDRFRVEDIPFEDYDERFPSFRYVRDHPPDLVLTSPPFFNYEQYNTSSKQSYVKHNTQEEWTERWLLPACNKMMDLLGDGGFLALYLSDTGKSYKYTDKARYSLLNRRDTIYVGVIRHKHEESYDKPLWIFRKVKDERL